MSFPLLQILRDFRASYWFLPSVMVVLAILLGAGMVWLDTGPASGLIEAIGWYQQSKPEGAREVLSAIAGSMITVAGVVFSITIVAISFAANQYGPRVLTNFMSDRGNQVTLGTFIATFVYAIVVLRTIQGGDSEFVPQLAIMVAMLLALCSIIVLIYFIHHVPESIHINTITAQVGRLLISSIEKQFPACLGDPPDQSDEQRKTFERKAELAFGDDGGVSIECKKDGYLQALDDEQLIATACEHDLLIRLERMPGQFLFRGRSLARATPASRVTDEVAGELRGSWSVGSSRTPDQDLLFLIDELVEIAARALSTGVNDPYTAMTCTDWLTAAAAEMARRQPPSHYRLDKKGVLRVISPAGDFELHLDRGFGRLRPYAAADVNAGSHFLCCLASLAGQCRSTEQIDVLAAEAEALLSMARRGLGGPSLDRIEEQMNATRAALADRRIRLSRDVSADGSSLPR